MTVPIVISFPPLPTPNIEYDSEEDENILDKIRREITSTMRAIPVTPKPSKKPTPKKKHSWGKMKTTPKVVVMKKTAKSAGGRGTHMRSASKGPGISPAKPIDLSDSATAVPLTVPSSRTPDTGAGEPRRSLRMHAKGDTDSVMKKAQKRKQGEGSSSSTGNMSKKVKNAVGEWIPIIEDAIPLNQYMPLELVPFLSDVEVFSQQGFAAANVLP
ncbi:uncharacterized protein LOC144544290 [Carex rostrata]